MGSVPLPDLFRECADASLTWWPELGVGYYPVKVGHAPYDAAYFERFAAQADSDIGRRLNSFRCALCERHADEAPVVDIGIGAGTFIDTRAARQRVTFGYDVNPAGIAWLKERELYLNPYEAESVPAITCWDVLEHIPDFERLISRVESHVFVSIPIFRDADHVRRSKHFRRDEHCWYFTERGLVATFARLGFDCLEVTDKESRIGREDILSFVFKRRTGRV